MITLRAIFKSVSVVVLYDIDIMTNKQTFDLSLKCPFTMLVSGPSGCGKSTFVRELIGPDKDIFSKPLVVGFLKFVCYAIPMGRCEGIRRSRGF